MRSQDVASLVTLYPMPDTGKAPILAPMQAATVSLDLEQYDLSDQDAIDTLKTAAANGLRVRVMLTPQTVSGDSHYEERAADLRAAGVEVEPTPPEFESDHSVAHAKFIVIDGTSLLFSTGNLSGSGLGCADPGYNNRDFWIYDRRPEAAAKAAALFQADWDRTSTRSMMFTYLTVTPENTNDRILSLLDGARKRLYVYNQEVQIDSVIDRLIAARHRGVDVRVLVAATNGHNPTPNEKNMEAVRYLQTNGVPAYPYSKYYLHAKAVVADDQVFVGSQDFSTGGLFYNREVGEILDDPVMAEQLAALFLEDFAISIVPTPSPAAGDTATD